MSLVITGATGRLGRLVVESLLQQGVPAPEITAAGRDTATVKDLADRGVRVLAIDYDDPARLDEAFRGTSTMRLAGEHQATEAALRASGLRRLIGRPTTSLHDAVAAALA